MDPQPLKGREKRGLVSDWTHQLTSFVRAASRYANSSNNTTDKEARSQRIIYIQSILPLIKVSFAPSVGFKFSKIMLHANQTSVRISLLSAWKKRNMAVPWSNAFWPGLTPFGPPMWQAEANTELTHCTVLGKSHLRADHHF